MKEDPRTMDIVNPELRGMPQEDYLEELNIRTHKAGYTTRDGKPIPIKSAISIPFGKEKLNIWPRNKKGRLVGDS